MSDALPNLFVTDHALMRWRERVAEYADAPECEVYFAVKRAVLVPEGEPLPFVRRPGCRYFRHATKPTVYFATEVRTEDAEAVLTVIDTEYRPPTTNVRKRPGPPGAAGVPLLDPEPAFPDIAARREWLTGRLREAEAVLTGLGRSDPRRVPWAVLCREIHDRFRLMRDEWQRFQMFVAIRKRQEAA